MNVECSEDVCDFLTFSLEHPVFVSNASNQLPLLALSYSCNNFRPLNSSNILPILAIFLARVIDQSSFCIRFCRSCSSFLCPAIRDSLRCLINIFNVSFDSVLTTPPSFFSEFELHRDPISVSVSSMVFHLSSIVLNVHVKLWSSWNLLQYPSVQSAYFSIHWLPAFQPSPLTALPFRGFTCSHDVQLELRSFVVCA